MPPELPRSVKAYADYIGRILGGDDATPAVTTGRAGVAPSTPSRFNQSAPAAVGIRDSRVGSAANPAAVEDPSIAADAELDDAMAAAGFVVLGNGSYLDPQSGKVFTRDQVRAGAMAGTGGSGGYSGPTYSTQVIGGQVYRISNRDGIPEPTGIMVPPSISATQIDRNGNLVGIKEDGTSVTIVEGFDYPTADPNIETFTDVTTGETKSRNKITGEIKTVGKFDFAQIDPERRFQAEIDAVNKGLEADERRAAETESRFARSEERASREFAQTESRLAEEMRRTRGLAENEAVTKILASPTDYLARAFLQRGVDAPLGQITQADIVKSLRDAISASSGGNVTPQGQVVGAPGGSRLAPQPAPMPSSVATSTPNVPVAAPAPAPSRVAGTISPITNNEVPTLASNTQGIEWVPGVGFQIPQQAAQAPAGGGLQLLGTRIVSPGGTETVEEETYTQPMTAAPTSPLLNIQSQEDIVRMAKQYAPPAVTALLEGTTEQLKPLNNGYAAVTPRQTSRLTQDDTQALATRLAAENRSIQDMADQQAQLFGKVRSSRLGRLVV